MPYTDIKTYQQNFIFELEDTATDKQYFRALTKTKPTNKWRIVCTNVGHYSFLPNELVAHSWWISNCPMLSGFSTTGTNNNILLATENVMVNNILDPTFRHNDLQIVKTAFIVDEIKNDPFTISATLMEDPFNLGNHDLLKAYITFEITEIERD